MNENINILVLKSFFIDKDIWLDDLFLLGEDYSIIAKKLLQINLDSGKVPSEGLFLKNLDKIDFKDIPDTEKIQFKSKVRTIFKVLIEMPETLNYERAELLELLREEYLSKNIQEVLPRMTKDLLNRDFVKVKGHLVQIENYLDKSNQDYIFEDNEGLFLETDNKLNFKYTGFDRNFPFSETPEGSLGLLIARSKQGKTSLMINSICNTFLEGNNIVIYSYEIPKVSIINRMLSYISEVGLQEINTDIYSVSDNEDRVKIARYVLAKEVTFKEAKKVYLEKGYEGLEELPTRQNKIIIRASITKSELELMKSKNMKPKKLPSDVEILQDIVSLNKVMKLDWVYIDYISLIPFVDSKNSRETNIANFSRNLKQVLLETSSCCLLLAQAKSKEAFFEPLYSQAIMLDSDFALSIFPTKSQQEENKTMIHLTLARHTTGFISFECEKHLEVQRFNYTGNSVDFEDFLEQIKQDNKGSAKQNHSN